MTESEPFASIADAERRAAEIREEFARRERERAEADKIMPNTQRGGRPSAAKPSLKISRP